MSYGLMRSCCSYIRSSLRHRSFSTMMSPTVKREGLHERTLLSKEDYLRLILTSRVYDVAVETPLQVAKSLSESLGNTVLLKREDTQPVFSFKLRGAHNKIAHLTKEQRRVGIVACSAGNHAQGVAMSARHLGIKATVVMPVTTPHIKVSAVRMWGASVVLHGDTFDDAKHLAESMVANQGLTLIHPYDDPLVIAGQGTIAMEIMKQIESDIDLHAIFVCVGGGGMIAGISTYIKTLYPHIKVIGVEPRDADAMARSIHEGERVTLDSVGLFAEGVAVKTVGEETFRVCQPLVDEWMLVGTEEICAAIKDGFNDTRTILEPAGALGIAGAKQYLEREDCKGKTVACITSGANMNFEKLRFVSERADEGEASLFVSIPEKPGTFYRLYKCVHPRAVTEFSYRYHKSSAEEAPLGADIYLSFRCSKNSDIDDVMNCMNDEGFRAIDVQGNEFAMQHARYLVGGRAQSVKNERLLSFEFPERPGALERFLECTGSEWNVSLFHYRNHGHDIGRVLAGIQVPEGRDDDFEKFLRQLGYEYTDESNNPVYKQFFL